MLEIKGQIKKSELDNLICDGFGDKVLLRVIDYNAIEVPELPNLTLKFDTQRPSDVSYWVEKLKDYFKIISVKGTDLS